MAKPRISEQALIIAYGLARLSEKGISALGCTTWTDCFEYVGTVLHEKPSSIKLLRDEFDALLPTPRKGWHKREPYESRARICEQLNDVSSDLLIQMMKAILAQGENLESKAENDPEEFVGRPESTSNPTERLLTGRRAEEFFIENCETILGVSSSALVDTRLGACGFDFALENTESLTIEVKGIKLASGAILFTEREWEEALKRGENYVLVVVTKLGSEVPGWKMIKNPATNLAFKSREVKAIQLQWTAFV